MRRVRAVGGGRIEVVSADRPAPGAGEVLVDTALCGICGTDTHAAHGQHAMLPPPYYPGHEATGTVAGLGDGVDGLAVGQRVVLKPNLPCGECVTCRRGRSNACQTLRWIGCDPSDTLPGAMAEAFLAPAGNLYPVGDDVDDETVALIECLATPVHAVRLAAEGYALPPDTGLTGARTVVIGAGTIGLLTVLAARHAGAERIVVSDLDPGKRDRATRHGADTAVDAAAGDWAEQVTAALAGPADVVFDCVANQRSSAQGVSVLRRAGTLLVVGIPAGDYALPMGPLADWELRVQGSANYTEDDFAEAVRIASAGGIPTADLVTARVALADAADAFVRAADPASGKVLVHP